jgi:hypothetical protein
MASKSIKKRLIAQAGITVEDLMQPSLTPARYCIWSDDSGHDYFIKVGEEKLFETWVAAAENYDQDYEGPDFEENRIDGRFTFTDPRNG